MADFHLQLCIAAEMAQVITRKGVAQGFIAFGGSPGRYQSFFERVTASSTGAFWCLESQVRLDCQCIV